MAALERMLHTPFDLLVISRELPDLNAISVVAAIRESRRRNSDIPVIVVSSNPAPVTKHLRISGVLRRDPQLRSILAGLVAEALDLRRSNQQAAAKRE